MDIANEVYARLDQMGIEYETMRHAPAMTIADCLENDKTLGAVTAKNYFLATKNLKNFYLCLVRPDARFRSADVSKQAGSARLHFGPEDKLEELLRVRPGAVSPMGLMFDEGKQVRLLVDSGLKDTERIAFHPCDNTQTLSMRTKDFFEKFLPALGREPLWIEIHDFLKEEGECESSGG